MESEQQKLELNTHYTPEMFREHFESNRISEDPVFKNLYASYDEDMSKARRLKEVYDKEKESGDLGLIGEALVYRCIEKGALGKAVTARGTNIYDDYYHGADIVIESTTRQLRDPIVGTVDVTLNQENIHAREMSDPHLFEGFANKELGFEKKLERIKKHVQRLALIKDDEAVALSAWLQRGGLLEKRGPKNDKFYEKAEQLMLLKYYKNPKTCEDPDKPRYVSSGPQVVVSLDTLFVNRALIQDPVKQKEALNHLGALIQAEVPLFVAMLSKYVEDVYEQAKQKNLGTNLFFASYRAACQAWEGTFSNEQYALRVQKAVSACTHDKDLHAQLAYFQKTLTKTLTV
jgi:hypothetical protein